jgi:ferredoxin
VLNIDGQKVVRSYSISSTPTRPYTLEITVRRVPGGLVSNWLFDNLRIGDRVEISGPKGRFCLTPVAEENDVDVAYGCRAGSGGECKVKVLSGQVEQDDAADGLSREERADGYVLACVARPTGACSLDL